MSLVSNAIKRCIIWMFVEVAHAINSWLLHQDDLSLAFIYAYLGRMFLV